MMLPSIFGENLFDEWMGNAFSNFVNADKELYGKHSKNMMKTDVKETDGAYQLAIELPGFDKNEITAQLQDGYLTITASKSLDKDEQDQEGRYIRRERYAGAMQRSFYVGTALQQEDIKAKYESGVLKLEVPKRDAKSVEQSRYIAIEG